MLNRFEKQPSEKIMIWASAVNNMSSTEKLVLGSCSVSAVDEDGTDVTSTLVDQSTLQLGDHPDKGGTNNILGVMVRNGESGKRYKVTFQLATDLGQVFEVDVVVYVKDH